MIFLVLETGIVVTFGWEVGTRGTGNIPFFGLGGGYVDMLILCNLSCFTVRICTLSGYNTLIF